MKNKTIDPVISEYMAELGRRGGNKNKEKGKEYFSRIGRIGGLKGKKNVDTKDSV